MKVFATIFATLAATAAAAPAPFPAPAPMDPPAPAADHHAPAPRFDYSSGLFPAPAPSKVGMTSRCLSAFTDACGNTNPKNCAACVNDNAMSLVANTCDTLEVVAKVCPTQPTSAFRKRNLLEAMPAPFPAPAPMDPPAPAEGHIRIAPAPEDSYDETWRFGFSPAPMGGSGEKPTEAACFNKKAGEDCEYVTDMADKIEGTCALVGDLMTCSGSVDDCDTTFNNYCAGFSGKACADCVTDYSVELTAAGCTTLKLISGTCFAK